MILNIVVRIAFVDILILVIYKKIFYNKKTDKVAYRVRRRIPVHHLIITSRYSQTRSINGRPCRYQSEAAERWKEKEGTRLD